MKPQPIRVTGKSDLWRWQPKRGVDVNMEHLNASLIAKYSPYEVGMTLWVREAWAVSTAYDSYAPRVLSPVGMGGQIAYAAGGGFNFHDGERGRWRQSIHMPRWACRTLLTVTDVRVERVQSISEADVRAEGVAEEHIEKWKKFLHPHDYAPTAFGELWDSIYAKRGLGWKENPWVLVITFKTMGGET